MRPIHLAFTSLAALALAACGSEAPTPTATEAPDAMATTDPMASANPMVGGAEMFPDKTLVANASAAPNLSTLVAAVKQAGLVETLSGTGPFTVFAPTNDAFAKVPKATIDGLMKPEGKAALTKVLTYHVVAGKVTGGDLAKLIADGGGKAELTTVEGEKLTATKDGTSIKIAGMGGSTAVVSQADVMQSNGVVHVIDGVLTPTL